MLNRPSIFTLAAAAVGFVIWLQPDILNGRVAGGGVEPVPAKAGQLLAAMPPLPSAETVQAAARFVAQATTPNPAPAAQDDRRNRLDEREKALERREALLKAAEQRLADKINELKLMQTSLDRPAKPADQAAAKPTDRDREEQLRRLVRVYEDMRPREAARIFEQMDQGLLMDVAGRMKSFKLAPVLAAMEPKKATQLTAELAKRKPVPRPAPAPGIGG